MPFKNAQVKKFKRAPSLSFSRVKIRAETNKLEKKINKLVDQQLIGNHFKIHSVILKQNKLPPASQM